MTPLRAAFASLLVLALAAAADDDTLVVPAGDAPRLDGKLDAAEWEGAAVFELRRAEDQLGRGLLRRSGRDLWIGFESVAPAFAMGVRLNFQDPVTRRRAVLIVVPLTPPRAPLGAWIESPGAPAERVSVEHADVRFDFPEAGFTFELRVPLDVLEIERTAKDYAFSAELWDLLANRAICVYPPSAGPTAQMPQARLSPAADWGADVPVAADAPPVQEALALLEEIEREPTPEEGAPTDGILNAHLGIWNGRRREAPLVALEKRLRRLIEAYPGYASLHANLVRVLAGRNRPEDALAALTTMRAAFPALRFNAGDVFMTMHLLRDLGRYEEAAAVLEENRELLAEAASVDEIAASLESLRAATRAEAEVRAEEAERDDLPRVRLETSKGAILLELFEDDAPNGVANFVTLVERGAYDGTRFHWAASGGRVVGGDPNSRNDDPYDDGFGDAGYLIEPEPGRRLNLPFMVAYSDRRRERRTESCAFVIHLTPTPELDGVNTVFGRVLEGQDAVRALEYHDEIEKAVVVRKRDHSYEVVKRPG